MSGFIRRFLTDPGLATILAIEGVVIIDQQPTGQITGTGSGFTCVLAELEDGPFGVPIEVSNNSDFLNTFGGFGFTYGGVPSQNPCARARKADGQLAAEYWNGNGFIAVVNKAFSRLAFVRVDTSVGSVQFAPLAAIQGNGNFEWSLVTGQVLAIDIGAGAVASTFTGAAATKNSSAGSYPTTFVGGEHIQFVVDAGTAQQLGPFDVYFQAADQSQAQVISRLNAAAGYAAFAVGGSNITSFTGRVQGSSGNVQVLAQDTAVGTKIGFNTTVAAGTGNVANILKVTFAEVQTVVQSAMPTVTVGRDSNNNLQLTANTAASITIGAGTTAAAFGFVLGQTDTNVVNLNGVIPAGTRVRNGSAVEWVTCQSVAVVAGSSGPYSVKVRPALDDGSNAGTVAGSVTVVPGPIPGGAWSVINPLPLSAALTEPAIDAAYQAAADATLSGNAVTRECNIIVSARASNTIRQKLRSNVLVASANGLYGRVAPIRPPLNTKRSDAKSIVTQPGVGAYRDERVIYCYPGANTNVPQIATRGLSGGAGFTADGNLDVGFDAWVASTMSQLAPEENPGQLTGFMSLINGLEVGNADVQNMDINDYIAFKAAGIAALRIDSGVAIIQSGVTSVDPLQLPGQTSIDRRRMADFIQDSLALALKPYTKKKATKVRRSEVYSIVDSFLNGLIGNENQNNQRIDGYTIDAKSANTPATLAAGVFRLIINVRTLSDLLDIVLQTNIGENVSLFQQAA
jgi:hypothetical protein